MAKKSIDNSFESIDKIDFSPKESFKPGVVGASLGLIGGIAGGFYLGEYIRNNFEILQSASQSIYYSINIISSLMGGGFGLISGFALGQIPGMYRMPKKVKK